MALFKELQKSRTGGARGLDGVTGENRLFQVIAEPEDIVEIPDGQGGKLGREMPDPRGLLNDSGLATLGQNHPWTAQAKLWQHVVVDTPARGHWIVRADYRADQTIASPTTGDWIISVRGATVSKQIVEELPAAESQIFKRERRGGELREVVDEVPPFPGVDRAPGGIRNIGPTIFNKIEPFLGPLPPATFKTFVTNQDGVQQTSFLAATAGRTLQPFSVDFPAMTVNFERVVPNFSLARAGEISGFMKVTNNQAFRGGIAAHVLVNDISIDPIDMIQEGQVDEGRSYRIAVSFLWAAEPWTPLKLVPTFKDEFGNETIVIYAAEFDGHQPGEKVVEEFRVRRTKNLERLMSILETG